MFEGGGAVKFFKKVVLKFFLKKAIRISGYLNTKLMSELRTVLSNIKFGIISFKVHKRVKEALYAFWLAEREEVIHVITSWQY